ncbi:bifunctional riboflavin kinase/FAD synthetase [Bacillus sp. 31A1R]|uniref:Riboflavin biosynthesis protein n=1 Tax=Robertmurraya mangrovi TaxID=3098077 RepID=A0ABU5J1Y5_9BACI|nr:bifunctional riboflavin kinase/FAD synthetase [Bacillus sp. 31A1R]MDZ5473433.1 bifunctional riboflavin kinase/FAD synthetase [Bacillus sp. 31A1R]
MEVITIHHPHNLQKEDFEPMAMALGYFDGVHLGHQRVIQTAKSVAKEKGIKSAVMTFDPHPSVILRREVQHVEYITPLEEKMELVNKLGIDYLFVVKFSHQFADLLPQEFIDQYIIGLNVVHLIAGFDYSYGKMGKGTMETISFHSRGKFDYTTVPKLTNGNEKVSSTLIRSFIKEGKMLELNSLLGRYYTTSGIVIHGDKRGRTIGFPTANIEIHDEYLIPPLGVYSVRILVEDLWYEGVCNIGYKPTFNKEQGHKPSVEVHIFDFNKEIYDQKVTVEWHKHIRSEKKFSGIDELVAQIERDKLESLSYFEKNNV